MAQLLISHKADLTDTHPSGATILYTSSQEGHSDVVKLLLVNKANVNQAKTTNGASPLYYASQKGHSDVVKLLLMNKANVNQARNDGILPIVIASFNGHLNMVQLLVSSKGDITDDAIRYAKSQGHPEIERFLKSHKQ